MKKLIKTRYISSKMIGPPQTRDNTQMKLIHGFGAKYDKKLW